MTTYKITIIYKDGDTHVVPNLDSINLLAWLISYLKNDVLVDPTPIKSLTVEVQP